ncbi:hypothetical protein [Caballeronia terrestris]|nr:hypothetical protein [Caballeronia terrestris]
MNIAQGRIEVKLVGDRQPPLTGLCSVPAEDGYVIAVERVDGVMPNELEAMPLPIAIGMRRQKMRRHPK